MSTQIESQQRASLPVERMQLPAPVQLQGVTQEAKTATPSIVSNSPRIARLMQLQHIASQSSPGKSIAQLQSIANGVSQQAAPIQRKENRTGLPENLKSGVESLSGMSMDHVRVHYNSQQPAQLSAHAYAQGSNIYIAPGQERHLAHEAWHVVQQAQGRVKPTLQLKGIGVNTDERLEREADEVAARIHQGGFGTTQLRAMQGGSNGPAVAQLAAPGTIEHATNSCHAATMINTFVVSPGLKNLLIAAQAAAAPGSLADLLLRAVNTVDATQNVPVDWAQRIMKRMAESGILPHAFRSEDVNIVIQRTITHLQAGNVARGQANGAAAHLEIPLLPNVTPLAAFTAILPAAAANPPNVLHFSGIARRAVAVPRQFVYQRNAHAPQITYTLKSIIEHKLYRDEDGNPVGHFVSYVDRGAGAEEWHFSDDVGPRVEGVDDITHVALEGGNAKGSKAAKAVASSSDLLKKGAKAETGKKAKDGDEVPAVTSSSKKAAKGKGDVAAPADENALQNGHAYVYVRQGVAEVAQAAAPVYDPNVAQALLGRYQAAYIARYGEEEEDAEDEAEEEEEVVVTSSKKKKAVAEDEDEAEVTSSRKKKGTDLLEQINDGIPLTSPSQFVALSGGQSMKLVRTAKKSSHARKSSTKTQKMHLGTETARRPRSYHGERTGQALRWVSIILMNELRNQGCNPEEIQAGYNPAEDRIYVAGNTNQSRVTLQNMFPADGASLKEVLLPLATAKRVNKAWDTPKNRFMKERYLRQAGKFVSRLGGDEADSDYEELEEALGEHPVVAMDKEKQNGLHAERRIRKRMGKNKFEQSRTRGVKRPCAVCFLEAYHGAPASTIPLFPRHAGPLWPSKAATHSLTLNETNLKRIADHVPESSATVPKSETAAKNPALTYDFDTESDSSDDEAVHSSADGPSKPVKRKKASHSSSSDSEEHASTSTKHVHKKLRAANTGDSGKAPKKKKGTDPKSKDDPRSKK